MTVRQIVRVLGVGGSTRPGSTAEQALRRALAEAERLGAEVDLIGGAQLVMPAYEPGAGMHAPAAKRLVAAIAAADSVIFASPAYHGSISGLVKNAIDYIEELRDDERPYLSGRPIGCVTVGDGRQGAVTALTALREVAHALRGWPTPLGVTLDKMATRFGPDGKWDDSRAEQQLRTMVGQVVEFAVHRGIALTEQAVPARSGDTPRVL
ncbi:NADPH-dependent FMN reductase [Streptomyces sp. NPDC059479]|uniref:NADPH-dependent FMN reductase n=1 Tax=Streptomyces sp. NPDC059479 TaxID=3346848 RepID=UPI0036BB38AB